MLARLAVAPSARSRSPSLLYRAFASTCTPASRRAVRPVVSTRPLLHSSSALGVGRCGCRFALRPGAHLCRRSFSSTEAAAAVNEYEEMTFEEAKAALQEALDRDVTDMREGPVDVEFEKYIASIGLEIHPPSESGSMLATCEKENYEVSLSFNMDVDDPDEELIEDENDVDDACADEPVEPVPMQLHSFEATIQRSDGQCMVLECVATEESRLLIESLQFTTGDDASLDAARETEDADDSSASVLYEDLSDDVQRALEDVLSYCEIEDRTALFVQIASREARRARHAAQLKTMRRFFEE